HRNHADPAQAGYSGSQDYMLSSFVLRALHKATKANNSGKKLSSTLAKKPMKLKALTIGLAMSFPMLVSAQSTTSVTLYGTVDTAVEYVNNIADGAGGTNRSFHFTNLTQSWPSHWGLRGSEYLGNGLSAVFTLESGFNAGTGTSGQGNRLFGRQAWVGLKGDWGQLAFGRQYNMLMWSMIHSDFLGPNAYGLGSLDNYIPNTRMDN